MERAPAASPRPRRSLGRWSPVVILSVLAFAAAVVPLDVEGLVASAIQDGLHVVGFALHAFFVVRAATFHRLDRAHVAAGLVAVVVVAVGTEGVQIVTARDSDLIDFARDLAGGVSGAAAYLALHAPTRLRRAVAIFVALVALAAPQAPVVDAIAVERARDRALPRLLGFEDPWERRLVLTNGATLVFHEEDRPFGRVHLYDHGYPALVLTLPPPDWSSYDAVAFEARSGRADTLDVIVRLDDQHHDDTFEDRFQTAITIDSTWRTFRIGFDDLSPAPNGRHLDRAHIDALVWFIRARDPLGFVLDLADVRLERATGDR